MIEMRENVSEKGAIPEEKIIFIELFCRAEDIAKKPNMVIIGITIPVSPEGCFTGSNRGSKRFFAPEDRIFPVTGFDRRDPSKNGYEIWEGKAYYEEKCN